MIDLEGDYLGKRIYLARATTDYLIDKLEKTILKNKYNYNDIKLLKKIEAKKYTLKSLTLSSWELELLLRIVKDDRIKKQLEYHYFTITKDEQIKKN